MSKVSVRSVILDEVSKVISEEIKRFNINFSKYDKISIKPNLCCYRGCETGATTDPFLVDALIGVIRSYNSDAKITIIESDTWAVDAELAFTILGYRAISDNYNAVSLINLSKDKTTKVDFDGLFFKKFDVPVTLLNTDFLITFPKLKTTVIDYITCALKNQYGCNPEIRKEKYHAVLSEVIVDLNTIFKPNFCIVDGLIAQDIGGPESGRPRRCDVMIFGNDMVSVDSEVLRLIGFEKYKCRHLELAAKAGLGEKKGYEIFGDKIGFNFEFSFWRHYLLKFNLFLENFKK